MIDNDYFGNWKKKVLRTQLYILIVEVVLSFYYAFLHFNEH